MSTAHHHRAPGKRADQVPPGLPLLPTDPGAGLSHPRRAFPALVSYPPRTREGLVLHEPGLACWCDPVECPACGGALHVIYTDGGIRLCGSCGRRPWE